MADASRRAPPAGGGQIVLAGRDIPYAIRRARRRKHVHLVIDERGGLEVRVPYRFGRARIAGLLQANEAWIIEALERAAGRRRPALVTGTPLPFLGETLLLQVAAGSPPAVARHGGALRLCHPLADQGALHGLLEHWYRGQARVKLPARLRALGAALGEPRPRRVQIRSQRTRWGSCSMRGTISLNWRLMLLPVEVVDYVLVHELCHLRHMDHSSAFWALLASVLPDHEARRRRLHAHQDRLPL